MTSSSHFTHSSPTAPIYSQPCMLITLHVPRVVIRQRTTCSLCRLFALHSAPTAAALQTITSGNLSLSPAVRGCTGADTFRRHLKTHFFPAGLPIRLAPSFWRLRFGFRWLLCAFMNYISLLTYLVSLRKELPIKAIFGTVLATLT